MNRRISFWISSPALALLLAANSAPSRAAVPTDTANAVEAFRISVIDDGVYRVFHADLASVEPIGSLPSDGLALSNHGQAVPIWLDDGGDGSFDDGDSFEFVGSHLAGDVSFYNEHSQHNIYRLALAGRQPLRMTAGAVAESTTSPAATLRASRHFERDALMVRFSRRNDPSEQETWFWRRLSFIDEEPFSAPLALEGLADGEFEVRVEMRGWSRHRMPKGSEVRQHRIEVAIDDRQIADGEWDSQELLTLESGPLPTSHLEANGSVLELRVPERTLEGASDPIVDLSLLNWLEIDYPHNGVLEGVQTQLIAAGSGLRHARLSAPEARSLVVFDDYGRRWAGETFGPGVELSPSIEEDNSSLAAVLDDNFRPAADITVDRSSTWRSTGHRADYLMITHESLLEGARRLADYHRSRGLEVAVVDVQDLYDEFNHGIVHPRAIRDFVSHAHRQWAAPAPRYVLLVGDASWDIYREDAEDQNYADWSYKPREGTREGFLKNKSTLYADGTKNRGLMPTGSYRNAEGHAASDNYFVAIDEDDFRPVLAIGRLPVISPEDLDAIVDKTIRYIEESGVGPWRRNLLWISNEDEYIQRRTDVLAGKQLELGFSADKVYPQKEEKSNEAHQERLLDAFAEGQLVVHFHGHGGRYIWRTGATDYKKNRDLFNLDHLDQLQPSARLPVVLSMTCFSAPFDHPLADSIGEKFLRLPDRGAIAVFAASWRNAPAAEFSRALVEELTQPQTIGDAVLTAKRGLKRRDMIETYNLLGDPAVPVAAPQARLEVAVESAADGLHLQASLPTAAANFSGQALIEWLSVDGEVIATHEVDAQGSTLDSTFPDAPDAVAAVSVYAWDSEQEIDGIGAFQFPVPNTETNTNTETEADTESTAASAANADENTAGDAVAESAVR